MIEQAIDCIREFSKSPCYCSVSWGKDSIVVAHLASIAAPSTPIAHLIITATISPNPDNDIVRDTYLEQSKQRYIESVGRDICQHDFTVIDRDAGTARYISGVRAEESGNRRMSRRVHGVSTEQACRPIIDWSLSDVFGYLAYFCLPIHPAYAMLGGGRWDRTQLRVASLGGVRGSERGRAEWEREYYGDVLRRLESRS